MRVLKKTYGDKCIYEWLKEELRALHKSKFGEDCIIIDHETGKAD